MLENRLDDILTRRGIAKLERQSILGCIDEGLAQQIIEAADAAPNLVEGLISEHYVNQKATPATEEDAPAIERAARGELESE